MHVSFCSAVVPCVAIGCGWKVEVKHIVAVVEAVVCGVLCSSPLHAALRSCKCVKHVLSVTMQLSSCRLPFIRTHVMWAVMLSSLQSESVLQQIHHMGMRDVPLNVLTFIHCEFGCLCK